MALKKCPLCGSRLVGGSCNECGYAVPDESEISSLYNYNPDDDRFGDSADGSYEEKYRMPETSEGGTKPEVREVRKVQRDLAYTNRRSPDVKVQPNGKLNVRTEKKNVNPYANFSPTDNQNNSPKSVFSGTGFDMQFTKDIIRAVVLSLILTPVAIFYIIKFALQYAKTKELKYLYAAVVLGIISIIGLIL